MNMNSEQLGERIRGRIGAADSYSPNGSEQVNLRLMMRIPLRVAAYALCAADDFNQNSSVQLIAHDAEDMVASAYAWTFAGAYIDQCGSSTPADERPEFNRMKQQAGHFNLVICKSLSCFAGDITDAITQVQWFREHGVGVYFESEDLYTLDTLPLLKLRFMGILAEEESRQKSRAMITLPEQLRRRSRKFWLPGILRSAKTVRILNEKEAQIAL